MPRVAIIGCGKIADQHVQAIRRIEGSRVVAACDMESLMADQLAERLGIAARYSDVSEMLHNEKPDVVHILTPPQSHSQLARLCLEAGSHVYLEKPFTVTAGEAKSLVNLAEKVQRKLTAGHNYQFTAEMLEMRRLVGEGYLGGRPLHLESYWSYDLGDASYVGPLLGSRSHWARRLPGQLMHNLISHGIARLAEFLDDEIVQLTALAHQSDTLRRMGGGEVMDELRVLIRDGSGTTATFCFTTQVKPGLNRFHIYGRRNSLALEHTSGSLIRHRGTSYKSYLTYLVPPVNAARENARNCWRNAMDIARGRLHQDGGMKELIERFHGAIEREGAPPISYREILLTARIMDAIFEQISAPSTLAGSPAVFHGGSESHGRQ